MYYAVRGSRWQIHTAHRFRCRVAVSDVRQHRGVVSAAEYSKKCVVSPFVEIDAKFEAVYSVGVVEDKNGRTEGLEVVGIFRMVEFTSLSGLGSLAMGCPPSAVIKWLMTPVAGFKKLKKRVKLVKPIYGLLQAPWVTT